MSTGIRTASNTNLVSFGRDGRKRTMLSLIPEYAEHGLKTLDLNFCEMMNPGSELNGDGWEYIEKLEKLKKEHGLLYIQAHAPYHRNYAALTNEDKKLSDKEILRSMEYAERLGIPHIVIHPIKGSVEDNVSYFSSLLERSPTSIMIAIENMEDDGISQPDDLLEICERLGGRAGIDKSDSIFQIRPLFCFQRCMPLGFLSITSCGYNNIITLRIIIIKKDITTKICNK